MGQAVAGLIVFLLLEARIDQEQPGVEKPRLHRRCTLRFGLSLLLTDDDTGQGATKTLGLKPCHLLPRDPKRIWRFLIPEYFPKVVLE